MLSSHGWFVSVTIQNNIWDFDSLSHMKMFYVSTATWEGVSGSWEKIKRTRRGVRRVMACCDSDRERMPLHHTVLLHSEYMWQIVSFVLVCFPPLKHICFPLCFFSPAELILQTVQNPFWSNLMECLYWLCAPPPLPFSLILWYFFFSLWWCWAGGEWVGGFMAVSSSLCSDL